VKTLLLFKNVFFSEIEFYGGRSDSARILQPRSGADVPRVGSHSHHRAHATDRSASPGW
jgi:hypothetical protein